MLLPMIKPYRSVFRIWGISFVVAALMAQAQPASAGDDHTPSPAIPGGKNQDPVAFTADELQVSDDQNHVTAIGNVEIVQEPRILTADKVEYDRRTGLMVAEGHVNLVENDQNIVFADRFEVSGDLKNGFADHLKLLLADDSRMAAIGGERRDGNKTILEKVVYSPCALCKDDPTKPPLWQVKARRAIHDEISHDVIYRDAVLEFGGVPVLYTPYFSHPDPDVYQRSGLLSTTFGSDSDLGGIIRTYSYLAIDPYLDTTIEATATTKQGELLGSEVRKRWDFGMLDIGGSLSNADRTRGSGATKEVIDPLVRGHFFANGRFDINNEWRTGLDLLRATDDSYLREFRYSDDDILRNRVYAEYFNRRDYAAINAYYFQDLRPGIPEDSPYVVPWLDYQMMGDPGETFGGRWQLDAGMQSLFRPEGADSYRMSLEGDWERRFYLPSGFLATTTIGTRGDIYFTQDQLDSRFATTSTKNSDTEIRLLPDAQATLSYPMIADLGWARHTLEPIASVVVSPSADSSQIDIPNEDSRDLEFDIDSLFARNHFSGSDRIETGTRFIYGLKSGWIGDWGSNRVFLGQSYRVGDDSTLPPNSGLEDHASDLVGSIRSQYRDYVDVDYRFRVDQHDFSSRRHEITSSIGTRDLRLNNAYFLAEGEPTSDFVQDREQLYSGISAGLTDFWSVGGYNRRDFSDQDDGTLATGLYLAYRDECFNFSVNAQRSYINRSGLDSGDTIYFRVGFKNLGELESPNFGPDLFGHNRN